MIIIAFRLENIMGSKKCLSSNTDSQASSRGRALALSRNRGRKDSDRSRQRPYFGSFDYCPGYKKMGPVHLGTVQRFHSNQLIGKRCDRTRSRKIGTGTLYE